MLTRILASSVRTIPWTLGSPFLSFFLCACDGLTKIHKSYGGGGQLYIYVGPYEIRFNFFQILFYFFLNTFFSVSIFLDSVFFHFHFMDSFLMIKLNCIYQKACLIN